MSQTKKYHVNQSPFYKLSNHKKLSGILYISQYTLKRVLKRGDDNYKFGSTDNGRSIQIPKTQLLRIHKRIAYLLKSIETPDYLVSGIKGRSHVYNANLHIGERAVAKTDIEKFYPSTTHEIVKKGFRKLFKCSEDIAATLAGLCTVNGHVPTGSSLSQSLCFIVNRPVFDEINRYARSRNLIFSLYVDDLTFSGKIIPKHFLKQISSILKNKRGYTCHKFRTIGQNKEKVITGVVVSSDGINLKYSQKKTIKDLSAQKNSYFTSDKISESESVKYYQRLIGHLFSAGQISSRYKQFGKEVVAERRLLGISAQNQNTK